MAVVLKIEEVLNVFKSKGYTLDKYPMAYRLRHPENKCYVGIQKVYEGFEVEELECKESFFYKKPLIFSTLEEMKKQMSDIITANIHVQQKNREYSSIYY